jgi:Bacteriophage head to tail connecting protein
MDENQTCSGKYAQLETTRTMFLDRARECAELTIPSLLPKDGHSSASRLPTPWQGIGARGVNNLASKLLLALLPPNSPFFRLQIDDFTLEKLTQQEGMRAKVEEGLNRIERSVMNEIEANAIRVGGFEALKQLLVTGNVLVYLPTEGGVRVFRLDRFVVKRDPMGNVLDIITKESVAAKTLPVEFQEAIKGADSGSKENDQNVDLYTHIYREGDKWKVYQEIKGKRLLGSEGSYPLDKSPWIPVRFTKIDGEDYGRGYVEEYIGDLKSLEGLSQAIVEGSAAAAKVLFMVNPNGVTDMAQLADADNGAFVEGIQTDVSTLQLNKFNDFRVALETVNTINERLSFAFLLNSAVQRSGERVTAEEIRYMANELESALGGIYSILSQEFQLPLVKRIMFQMERQKKLPVLPTGTVQPVIVTGMEALGRGNDLNKLNMFFQAAVQIAQLPPEINKNDALMRTGSSLGIDMKGLVKSEEELQAEQQQAQQQQMMALAMEKGIGPAVQAGGRMMEQGMQQNDQSQEQG